MCRQYRSRKRHSDDFKVERLINEPEGVKTLFMVNK